LSYSLNIRKDTEYSTETRYDYKRMNIIDAQEELQKIEWNKLLNGTVNENWDRLKEILFETQRKYVPLIKSDRK